MTHDCQYCGASFIDRDAYVRHLATAHESDELSPIDARRVKNYQPESMLADEREYIHSHLTERMGLTGVRLPVGRGEFAQLTIIALLASFFASLVLAL